MSNDKHTPTSESFGSFVQRHLDSDQSETIATLRAEKAELIEALRWISVQDKLPKPLQTVWITNGKGWTSLGCLIVDSEGSHWAESNGIVYQEGDDIVSECESDDLDVNYWMALPKVIISGL
jgi:hypothetical protein